MAPNFFELPTKRLAVAASAATATVLGALYANHRYALTYDIDQLLRERAFRHRLQARIAQLGDDVSLYRMLELADPNAEALWFEDRRWAFSELILETDRLASVLSRRGVTAGDNVAVFTTNSPEMVLSIAAISKLGAIPALINTSLRSQTLVHCLHIAQSKLLICTPDLAPAVAETDVTAQLSIISLSTHAFSQVQPTAKQCFAANIKQLCHEDLVAEASLASPQPRGPGTSIKETGALVYTSGTSGKPKAVAVKNFLLVLASTPLTVDVRSRRRYMPLRTFSCLPLFHATGLFLGLYYSVGLSSTLCLARKFSASRFSSQLVESRATRMLYVGELCRYLLAAPESSTDRAHKCTVAAGNGLQRDVWLSFKRRFGIPEIREVYRSTEGIAKFDNFTTSDADAGAVGRAGLIRSYVEDDTFLVRYDPSAEGPYRDPSTGFCVPAGTGEAGEAIGRIRSMEFYNEYLDNAAANEEKFLRDVFKKGDLFQRTGDLLVRDAWGRISFHDRAGDTFRWRGENVSAGEVREHINRLRNVQDASVYGVKLSGYDGQAGAAAITLDEEQDEADFARRLYQRLRSGGLTLYQVPRLIRFCKLIDTTATFKQQKGELKDRPWDPNAKDQQDSIYWLRGEEYVKMDAVGWGQIQAAKARL
ncbi:hypothetical protein ACJ41O_012522 [Fusarium nematophilum]